MDGNDWYEYCRSNPINYYDPDGKTPYIFKYKHKDGTIEYDFYNTRRGFDAANIAISLIPLAGTATWCGNRLVGFEEINLDVLRKGSTIASDILQNIQYLNNIKFMSAAGKAISGLNYFLTGCDAIDFATDTDYITDQIISKMLVAGFLSSSTK